MPRKLKSTALRSDAVTVANIPDGEISTSKIADSAITHSKLHTTAIQDKLGYTPVSPTQLTTEINNLIAGAPGALNTLDELAAALGDDANYAATITTALTAKANSSDVTTALAGKQNTLGYTPVNKAGDTITGNLTIEKINPAIHLKDTADAGVDVAIGAFGENFFVFEPEDNSGTLTPDNSSRQWLRIEDDGDAFLMGNRKIWHNSAMPKPVINVSNYEDGSMITVSGSANTTYFSFNIQKLSSTSLLYVTGNIPTSGGENHGLYYFISFNGTRKFRGISDSMRSHGSPSSTTPGMINVNSVSQSGIAAGTVSIGIGIQPIDGSSNRPIYFINPNSSIDSRNISGTVMTVWEVEQ
jgi:hypothetical protein